MNSNDVRPLDGDDDVAAYAEILSWAFSTPRTEATEWIGKGGRENVRVLARDKSVAAALLHVPMGQWWGGRSVPMTGIAGVGVLPEARGGGAARALLEATVAELAERGVPLSVLYPSTLPFYRSVGYEQAGARYRMNAEIAPLGFRDREPELRRMTSDDVPAVRAAYSALARGCAGYLDRGEYIWERIGRLGNEPTTGYVVDPGGEIEGYVLLGQRATGGMWHDLVLTDVVVLTERAARRLLGFFSSDRTLGHRIKWQGGSGDRLAGLLPDAAFEQTLANHWMLRIVDVKGALEARGYAPLVAGRLELDVRDVLVPANQGRFVLEVSEGRGLVRPGGAGTLRLDIRGLATLYAGFRTPDALAVAGLLAGDDEARRTAGALFAGPAPGMPDGF